MLSQFLSNEPRFSLESHMERIAIEANFVVNLIETFKNTLPDFLTKLKEFDQRLIGFVSSPMTPSASLTKKQREAVEVSKHMDFLNFGERLITVPENFNGNLLQYARLLNKITPQFFIAEKVALLEYSNILSSFLTNKEDKFSIKDHTAFFNRLRHDREEVSRLLNSFFPRATNVSKVRLKTVMSRMAELNEVIQETTKLDTALARTRVNDIHESTTHCVDLLNMIIEGVRDGKIDHISSNATINISTGAFEVGKYLEMVGTLYYDTMVLINVVDLLMDNFINVNSEVN